MTSQYGPVGMVGVGNMGGRMTLRMTETGYGVRAADAGASRISPAGGKPAASLAEFAGDGDVIATAEVTVAAKKAGLGLLSLTEDLGVPTLVGPGTLTASPVSNALGYRYVISNRVVDAYGDTQLRTRRCRKGAMKRRSHASGLPGGRRTGTCPVPHHLSLTSGTSGVLVMTGIRRRAAVAIAAPAVAALTLAACSSGGSSGSGGSSPILIGEVAGTTGAYGTTGQAMVNGAKMAVADLNAHGGILGRKVTLQSYNDSASATLAAQEFDRLVSAGAVAITGSGDTGPAIAAEADRRQVPAIGVVDDGGLTVYPNGPTSSPLPWVFDLGLNTFAWGGKIASYALAHCSGLAVLHDPTTYGGGGEQAIKSAYTAAGKKLAFDSAITEDWSSGATVGLTSEINQIKATGADCVDVWLTPQDQAAFVQAAHNQGANFTILGNDETDSDTTYSGLAKSLADGTVSALLTSEVSPDSTLKAFQAKYQEQFGTPSTPFAEATYDSIMMLKQAIESAKSTDHKAVQNAFNHITGFAGLTGTLGFSATKHTTINADQLTLVKYDAATQQWVPVS